MNLQPYYYIIWLELLFERFVRWAMYFNSSSRNHFLCRPMSYGMFVSLYSILLGTNEEE